jgi:hypothetical protein
MLNARPSWDANEAARYPREWPLNVAAVCGAPQRVIGGNGKVDLRWRDQKLSELAMRAREFGAVRGRGGGALNETKGGRIVSAEESHRKGWSAGIEPRIQLRAAALPATTREVIHAICVMLGNGRR